MVDPSGEAAELMREYCHYHGHEWPGFAAEALMRRISIKENRWTDWSQVAEVDEVLSHACFDVDDLARDYLGIRLIVEDLRNLDAYAGSPVFGFARPGTWSISICQRAQRYLPLYRATVMHEIGHLRLHPVERPRMLAYTPYAPVRPAEEREADDFMHEGLLPRPVLLLATAMFAAGWGLSVQELLRGANTTHSRWRWRRRILRPLIDSLAVSRELICIKLKQMGIFNAETLAYHLSYPLPTKWKHEGAPLRLPIKRLMARWT